jgi:cyanophycinase
MTQKRRMVAVRLTYLAWTLAAITSIAVAQLPSHGPTKGYLLIIGGLTGPADFRRFIEMSGGKNARIVVIPTAAVTEPTEQAHLQEQYCGPKSPFAAVSCTVLHTTNRTIADSADFVAPLTTATGVWLEGGRHGRLTDAYLDTRTQKEMFNLLNRGGVICGGSAGATVQGSYMVRGSSNPNDNTIMALGHEVGFGFFTNVTIDTHVDTRRRQYDLAPVIKLHPGLLGLGLDQNTSITVHGDKLTVNGPMRVAVWDGKDHDGRSFYYLQTGDQLNTATRVPTLLPHAGATSDK